VCSGGVEGENICIYVCVFSEEGTGLNRRRRRGEHMYIYVCVCVYGHDRIPVI